MNQQAQLGSCYNRAHKYEIHHPVDTAMIKEIKH
ncbi:hypothetical protein DFP97_10143 [Paenibacillus prosopidis]|uniref:Uncharacterized protein n=1 Tax=Paenibacillus prosopidis TaxID=630520 RepID=A0A368W8Q7_9BACL|nr:hypothetical protein DFP97_10143 [Paenibacillus prosopidis]